MRRNKGFGVKLNALLVYNRTVNRRPFLLLRNLFFYVVYT